MLVQRGGGEYHSHLLVSVSHHVTLHKAVNICSKYIPPSNDIDENEVKKLVNQLPKHFILLGDFNSHNTLWECKDKQKGKNLEKVINENDMCLLKNGALTYVNSFGRNHSAIDLTICKTTIYMVVITFSSWSKEQSSAAEKYSAGS